MNAAGSDNTEMDVGLEPTQRNDCVMSSSDSTQEKIKCNSCNENEASKFCIDCSYNYCSLCLAHHERFPATANHRLQPMKKSLMFGTDCLEYTECSQHLEAMNLFCEECKMSICVLCLINEHNTHKMKHMNDYFVSVKDKLEDYLKIKENVLETALFNYQLACNAFSEYEKKAADLTDQIYQRAEYMKKVVDSIAAEFDKNVQEGLGEQKRQTVKILVELKNFEANVTTQIEDLKMIIKDLNYSNVVEASLIKHGDEVVPKYSKELKISLAVDDNFDQKTVLEKMFGTLRKGRNFRFIKEIKYGGCVKSFASSQETIFVSYWNEIKVDAFTCGGSLLIKSCDYKDLLSRVFDLLSFDDTLVIAGRSCDVDKIGIVKSNGTLSIRELIYKCPYQDDVCRLTASTCMNILLILKSGIKLLSKNGCILKEINFSFNIVNALQLDEKHYFVCGKHREVMIVDDTATIVTKYSPPSEFYKIMSPLALAKDIYGNIFVGDNFGEAKLFALDVNLNYVSSFTVGRFLHKIHYDEAGDLLMVMPNESSLVIYDL